MITFITTLFLIFCENSFLSKDRTIIKTSNKNLKIYKYSILFGKKEKRQVCIAKSHSIIQDDPSLAIFFGVELVTKPDCASIIFVCLSALIDSLF